MVEILRNPTNQDLVNAIHYNLRSQFFMFRKAPIFEWFEESDATYFMRSNQTPIYNRVEKTNLTSESADQRISEIKSVFTSRNMPFTWAINPDDKPDDLASRLEKAGLKRSEAPSMALELKNLRMPKCPEGFTIEVPKGTKEVDAWARLMLDAYGMSAGYTESFVKMIHNGSQRKDVLFYTGLLDGLPVATNLIFLSDGVAGVYCIATDPSVRGKGIGSYITAAPLLDARDMGFEVSILHATRMGYPVYERLGYREVCKKVTYSWSPPPVTT
ncbi:GNAT family N-acetyltransferase [Candidatus Bathyarchaeota archaeon]|nr:GNAT family N-acetyltransferase [Candidatus Bathyarchaeota archaeon]